MVTVNRITTAAWLGGICAGVAYSLAIPTWLVRLVVVILVLTGMGSGIIIYIVLWIFVPPLRFTPPDYAQRTGDVSRG